MIGFLQGGILSTHEEGLLLNVRGVGYEVTCSSNTLNEISGEPRVQLWVHTHVREDQFHLFGFANQVEKQLFLSLIKVNGIGPKLAIKILSGARTESIVAMIDEGDVKGLTGLPKIGKKTAEQMILTLKGKLVTESAGSSQMAFAARGEIVSALVNLGFKLTDVEGVVNEMEPTLDLEQGVREGLSALATL